MKFVLFIVAVACPSDFAIRCDERCRYEWNTSGIANGTDCRCQVKIDVKSPAPIKIERVITKEEDEE